MNLGEIKKKRAEFLIKVYTLSNGNIHSSFSMWETGKSLGLDQDNIRKIKEYLEGEGWIKTSGMGGMISITHEGIKKVEEEIEGKKEEKSSQINIVNVKNMINSQIQQARDNPNQVLVGTLEGYKNKGYIAGIISIVISIIFIIMVFNIGWDLTGQIFTAIGALFGILGIGSIIKPASIGQITSQILHKIMENGEKSR